MRDFMTAAAQIEQGDKIKVTYNSARSDDTQVAEGKVENVVIHHQNGGVDGRIEFVRRDSQKMFVKDDDTVISRNSLYPRTGYAFDYKITSE